MRSCKGIATILAVILSQGLAMAGEWDSLVESYGKLREARRENFVRVLARKNPEKLDGALAALIQAYPVDADMIVMTAGGTVPQRGEDIREGLRAGLGMPLEQLKTLDRKLLTLVEHWSVLAPGGLEGKSFHEVRAEAEKEGVIVERLRKLDAEGGLELGVRRDPQGRDDLLGGGR
jgi:hypothetical protein